ncbi:MAG: CBS domain-containing protein [Deltaproteobacteria bacterium]|nr:CBS domain-containing protein [Deltaproteobacteria bacterium]
MGTQEVGTDTRDDQVRTFTRAMLADLQGLEALFEKGMIESGVQRIGVEQEMTLVRPSGRPALVSTDILESLGDSRLTTELALFNLEANLPPHPFGGAFLRRLEEELSGVIDTVDQAAREAGARVLLTGILPTLRDQDLSLAAMTPLPRYRQLNKALLSLADGPFHIFIRGVDEIEMRPSSVMFEAANTSLQLHLQVSLEEFPRRYNLAQLISAPLLAVAVNSPLFLGRRLWHESRVALFERSVDTRSDAARARGRVPRVSFGDNWIQESPLELFRDAVARFPVALTCEPGPPAVELVEQGIAPKLPALMLHNGTVWRWNRACYGIADGVAHLRIENRILPAGPTVLDEVANAALFYGLMVGLDDLSHDLPDRLPFDSAKGNFIKAARQGLGAELTWLEGRRVSVKDLLAEELLPAARRGLRTLKVPQKDIDRYLGTLEARVSSATTGARWMLDAFSSLGNESSVDARAARVTRAMQRYQDEEKPVHQWPLPTVSKSKFGRALSTVSDIMSTDLFTVRPGDIIDLATSMMSWKHFRHVPVETTDGDLVGLVSHRTLLRLQQGATSRESSEPKAVEDIMDRQPLQVSPCLSLREGMRRLFDSGRGCLLVVSENRLVGIVTERDFLGAAVELLPEEKVRSETG